MGAGARAGGGVMNVWLLMLWAGLAFTVYRVVTMLYSALMGEE